MSKPSATRVGVYTGQSLADYGFGPEHPFNNQRHEAFIQALKMQGLDTRIQHCEPVMAEASALERFHTPEYVARVRQLSLTGQGYVDYGDTPAFAGMYETTRSVVGSVLDAIAQILAGTLTRAFIPIAGLHHARRDGGAGFCIFNDCGVAIETLRQVHGIRCLAYVDIDAHHGDGVFYAFESDSDLCVVDFHEDGRYLYPGTGRPEENGLGPARGSKLNVPMPPGAGDAAILERWPEAEAFIREARPEFILLQCGADSLEGDPLTHLRYSEQAHAHVTRRLCRLADERCQGRLLALGGGGYNLHNIGRAWTAVVRALLGNEA